MKRINYKSDFKITEFSQVNYAVLPFKFTYYTGCSEEVVYIASYNGETWENCAKVDDYSVNITFDNHGLEPGSLKVKREFFISDSQYKDGEAHLIQYDKCEVFLVRDGAVSSNCLVFDNKIAPNFNNEFSGYYTKEEIDQKIDKLNAGDIDLQNYYTKSQTDTKFATKTELENLKPEVDLSDYATKEDLQDFPTKEEIEAKGYLTEHQSLAGYYTKTEVDSKLGDIDTLLTEILG